MADSERERVLGYIFDPDVSPILSELEDGPKDITYLAEKLGIEPKLITERLSYLIEHDYIAESDSEPVTYTVNAEKLGKLMENDANFEGAIDGMTKLDSFLN